MHPSKWLIIRETTYHEPPGESIGSGSNQFSLISEGRELKGLLVNLAFDPTLGVETIFGIFEVFSCPSKTIFMEKNPIN